MGRRHGFWFFLAVLLAGCGGSDPPLPPGKALAVAAGRIDGLLTDEARFEPALVFPSSREAGPSARIDFWFCSHPLIGPLLGAPTSAKDFNAEHPGFDLRPLFIGDWRLAVQKLTVSLAAGESTRPRPRNPLTWQPGWPTPGGLSRSTISCHRISWLISRRASWTRSASTGRLYGLPADGFCHVLFYNKDALPGDSPEDWHAATRGCTYVAAISR